MFIYLVSQLIINNIVSSTNFHKIKLLQFTYSHRKMELICKIKGEIIEIMIALVTVKIKHGKSSG